jgi:hypothetical protein
MYRFVRAGIKEVIMPMVNPLNPRNVNEVLRRDKVLRAETSRREHEYGDDPLSRPKRKWHLRNLVKLIGGRSD